MWYSYKFADKAEIICLGMSARELSAAVREHGDLLSKDKFPEKKDGKWRVTKK